MCGLKETTVGLRIDVDTLRGTRLGVPGLLEVLARNGIKATFFFSVGPDNMGRHLRRLLRPAFFLKMMRSKAVGLYGWDIFLRGTLWPGPHIGKACDSILRHTAEAGHEIGLHAWDHYLWQRNVGAMDDVAVRFELRKGKKELERIIGRPVFCSAVPGWRCTDTVLLEKEHLGFQYNSDCRGHAVFYPKVKDRCLSQPQVPVTLPTYDELIGRNGINDTTYNDHLLSLILPDRLNVLTIHAEAEGIICLGMFEDFLKKARARNIYLNSLSHILTDSSSIGCSRMIRRTIQGREGWISCRESTVDHNNDK